MTGARHDHGQLRVDQGALKGASSPRVDALRARVLKDPFYVIPARKAAAEWFADQWHRLNITANWHYRRIHYVFISQAGAVRVLMLNGKPYENTVECWDALCGAIRDAIVLELVPHDAFVDHRNAEPIAYLVEPQESDSHITSSLLNFAVLPSFPSPPRLVLDRPTVPQPYHVEVWCEKSTINDILVPLASQYEFNLVTGIGELSYTRCREFVARAAGNGGRPVRILYISDFDPGGLSMPVAVARKVEYELHRRSLELDIQLRPIVLTHEQCVEYRLPRTPIKETERRAARFEERFGEGATELDALEALHPGLLWQIVLDEVWRYWNEDHDDAVGEKCATVEKQFDAITTEAPDRYRDDIAALRADWQRIIAEIKAWNRQAEPTWRAITAWLEETLPSLDDVEWRPDFVADEDPDPLYDSTRSYVEQIDRYKRHQDKPTGRKPRANGSAP